MNTSSGNADRNGAKAHGDSGHADRNGGKAPGSSGDADRNGANAHKNVPSAAVIRDDLRHRTKQFALRIVRLYRALPHKTEAFVIGKQMLRSGTAVGANYRAACVSRSRAEFIARMGVVVEEANETVFWLELLMESEIVPAWQLQQLLTEANELTRIFAASWKTAKDRAGSN